MDIDSEVIKKNICFVLPTYNEEGNIENTIEQILVEEKKQNKYVFSILVVDDNSTDQTQPIVRRIIESKDNIHLVTGEKKGLGTLTNADFCMRLRFWKLISFFKWIRMGNTTYL